MLKVASKVVFAVTGLASLAVITGSDQADAGRREHWDTVGQCQSAVEGAATSRGILGSGTARARDAALSNWEINVEDKYGPAYSNMDYAQNIRWDCKRGAVILAKCVVVAKPCRARLRG